MLPPPPPWWPQPSTHMVSSQWKASLLILFAPQRQLELAHRTAGVGAAVAQDSRGQICSQHLTGHPGTRACLEQVDGGQGSGTGAAWRLTPTHRAAGEGS